MYDAITEALEADRLVDITTTGRKSGQPHRIEIGFHYLNGDVFISGTPGRRGWLANLIASPQFTFHLKQSLIVDIPATATPILAADKRREIFTKIAERRQGRQAMDIDAWVDGSPLILVQFHTPDQHPGHYE